MNITVKPDKKDHIKLKKTTRGYTWVIKRYYDNDTMDYKKVIVNLTRIDRLMRKSFNEHTQT